MQKGNTTHHEYDHNWRIDIEYSFTDTTQMVAVDKMLRKAVGKSSDDSGCLFGDPSIRDHTWYFKGEKEMMKAWKVFDDIHHDIPDRRHFSLKVYRWDFRVEQIKTREDAKKFGVEWMMNPTEVQVTVNWEELEGSWTLHPLSEGSEEPIGEWIRYTLCDGSEDGHMFIYSAEDMWDEKITIRHTERGKSISAAEYESISS